MKDIRIRPVAAEHHQAWLPLWQAYLSFYKTELAAGVSEVTWARMIDPNEATHSALAWLDGKAVGMVNFIYHRSNWSIHNACYLQDLFVAPEHRGTGVGRQLIEFVYATAKADGCDKVHWLTHESNATAIQLYERIAERPGLIQFRKAL
ncbi:GNAT family N-acetyltransferase [Pseudomonas tremae]|uniref:GNAT family acetyltransferase n=1 Tax=Pseudomonas coronafaciens pv. porri TaxID=83964 RepID=A0ABR5JT14_9PSED|nr:MULTISPECIES: GNAT family N-acetyltransferase [Pseudomonas syringae group]KOP57651.1 GNAT family acetyltransferase [Pseudomonas coronafaciens pv. porri]KOP60550.1 GNAT family acetyltransferase [Pseudomonas coronafaciens pv. porri]KPB55668.1 GNAT family acetyltransferase [Pseudomonas coronafaciens pv. oryzae]KPY06527.1 GNAT family acetyltransferase [Pseudomonas coronafaciens pv. oryzae]KPY25896.1 GNAT family acetyltransferase [Pseudomonas coronafaciens pv. porri]